MTRGFWCSTSLQEGAPARRTDPSSRNDAWWRENFDLEGYYSFRAIVEGIHHNDIGHGKNYFYEIESTWESEMMREFSDAITLPADAVTAGRTYRVRVRFMDDTGRWSHWSAPVELQVGS